VTAVLPVPGLTDPAKPKKLSASERTLPSGLRVVAVRRPSVPMVEVRLRVPFFSGKASHLARATLLSGTILTGTGERDRIGLAVALGQLGGDISVSVDADRLQLSGSALASRLPALLDLYAEILSSASYSATEVAGERERLIERITMSRAQPGVIANEALARRVAPGHPYAELLPNTEAVAATTASQLRNLHRDLVLPEGSLLVIVGDVSASRALDVAESALAEWTGGPAKVKLAPLPALRPGPLQIIDRPGSVQTSIRLSGTALPRRDERYSALQLANLIFGGYFSSRWVENIREDKGYSYSPRSGLDHLALGSSFTVTADVATEVTAPAILETMYELGRIASLPVTETELESVRQYAIGNLAMSTSTQAGIATTLSTLLGTGLSIDWLAEQPVRLSKVTVAEVAEVASEFLSPRKLVGVAVGDATTITAPLSRVIDVE